MNKNRLNETNINTKGEKMTIVEYKDRYNITVEFECGYRTKTTYPNFKKGNVKNVYYRSVYGIGYIGEGNFKACKNKERNNYYGIWSDMLRRCYSEKYRDKKPSYVGCTVCEEWHNFQNFAKWYEENYYEFEDEIMQLDKDILVKGNRVYSPKTCLILPNSINSIFKCDYEADVKLLIEKLDTYYKDIPETVKSKLNKALINRLTYKQ